MFPTPSSPIFVAGCGRSGTTLLRTILDAHPDIFIPTESLFLADYLKDGESLPRFLRKYLFFREPQLRCWYMDKPFEIDSFGEAVEQIHRIAAKEFGASRWGQKTPRFIRYIDLFHSIFPHSKWILIYRDPRAVVASMLKSKRHTYSLKFACQRWVRDNRHLLAIRDSSEKWDNVLIMQYENLIQHLDSYLQNIFQFVAVKPIGMEMIEKNARISRLTGSRFEIITVREGVRPQEKFIDNWKHVLNTSQIEFIESYCAQEMERLGYHPLSAGVEQRQGRHIPLLQIQESLNLVKNLGVVYQYITKWPQYPLYTLLRKTVLSVFKTVCAIRSR